MLRKFQKGLISIPTEISKDTSHYGKCREILKKIEQHNTLRISVAAVSLVINFFYILIIITMQSGILVTIFALLYNILLLAASDTDPA